MKPRSWFSSQKTNVMESIGTSTHFCTLLGYTWTGALRPVLKILVLFPSIYFERWMNDPAQIHVSCPVPIFFAIYRMLGSFLYQNWCYFVWNGSTARKTKIYPSRFILLLPWCSGLICRKGFVNLPQNLRAECWVLNSRWEKLMKQNIWGKASKMANVKSCNPIAFPWNRKKKMEWIPQPARANHRLKQQHATVLVDPMRET